jgi:hypothetical protein
VAVINRSMAQQYWPGENPVGRQLRAASMERQADGQAPWITIVGVVGDVRHWGMEAEARAEMYVDYRQVSAWAYGMTAVVRGGAAVSLLPAVQRRLRELDPTVAVVMGTLRDRLDRSLANRRFVMSVLTGFSGLALLLAAIGLYAVLAYSVSRRTRELAVRTALGATRKQLLWLVFSGAARVVVVGMLIGTAAAALLSRSMKVFLVDIVPLDPVSFALAATVLVGIATLATLVPALRATRAHPSAALQQE